MSQLPVYHHPSDSKRLVESFMRLLKLKRRETDVIQMHVVGYCAVSKMHYDMSSDLPVEGATRDLQFYMSKKETCGDCGAVLRLYLGLPK